MVYQLWHEHGVLVDRSTISRLLKANNQSKKKLQQITIGRSKELRRLFKANMARFIAEDLVFLDESIFNEKTGQRHRAYALIGEEARYEADIRRGLTQSIYAAITIKGWIPYIGVKEGYFSRDYFLNQLTYQFLLSLRQLYPNRTLVIVLNNVSIHISDKVREVIEAKGYLIRFLLPYSPNYNPIKLIFSILKAWIKRQFYYLRSKYFDFRSFLRYSTKPL